MYQKKDRNSLNVEQFKKDQLVHHKVAPTQFPKATLNLLWYDGTPKLEHYNPNQIWMDHCIEKITFQTSKLEPTKRC
ncbi:hypothetical protein SLEP1_g31414 [Rubroshorea leprosula]|uniref:Uncharacterized protein n=1 Tax=Rubroshorea leprosula TaxID=152421 RepID=A0AAV5K817_9ROSI|nr:hypothetical protein SLEP1_g31414 [Rubroshorea leprosula]